LGDSCYIQQYVDRDPGENVTDFTCSDLSYDGHKGTDFALPTLSDLEAGVNVISVAPGTVVAVRNDMIDMLADNPNAPDVTGRECGNGLVVRHGGGWETQYCHLKQGSVSVQVGQTVATGTVLGLVGLSGQTEFPHLHLSVRKDGAVIDPFDPDQPLACGDNTHDPLWANDIDYVAGGILEAGFDSRVPDYTDIKAGTAGITSLTAGAPALVAWVFAFGGQQGDEMQIAITLPDGEVMTETSTVLERNQAQFYRAAGRRVREGGWPSGDYRAVFTFMRAGAVVDSKTQTLSVP
jgi:hypothetical protein